MITFKQKENFSLLLLIPLVFDDRKSINKYLIDENTNFINAYSVDVNNPKFNRNLFLLFNSDKIIKDEDDLIENDGFIYRKRYIIDNNHYTSFVYSIDFSYEKDYYTILDGQYTEISESTKKTILSFWINTGRYDRVKNILYKKFNYYKTLDDFIPEEDLLYNYIELI